MNNLDSHCAADKPDHNGRENDFRPMVDMADPHLLNSVFKTQDMGNSFLSPSGQLTITDPFKEIASTFNNDNFKNGTWTISETISPDQFSLNISFKASDAAICDSQASSAAQSAIDSSSAGSSTAGDTGATKSNGDSANSVATTPGDQGQAPATASDGNTTSTVSTAESASSVKSGDSNVTASADNSNSVSQVQTGDTLATDPVTGAPRSVAALESMMGTNPGTGGNDVIIPDMKYIGLTKIRDHATPEQLAAGLEGMPVLNSGTITSSDALKKWVDSLGAEEQSHPGSITLIEGANEVNNWPVQFDGKTGPEAAIAQQQALYQAVHENSTLQEAGTKVVLGTSLDWAATGNWGKFNANPISSTYPGGQLADIMNDHPYPSDLIHPQDHLTNLNNPYGSFTDANGNQVAFDTKGQVISETGLQESDPRFAQDTLMMWLQGAKHGETIYNYDLATKTDQGENGWGMFDANNNPTAAAKATHNFTSFLAQQSDSGASLGEVNYKASGIDESKGGSLMLDNGPHTKDLVLWNQDGGSSEVSLDGNYNVTEYDPVTGQTTSLGKVNQVSVSLDDPTILQISG